MENEDLNETTKIDNSRLEKIMSEDLTAESQDEFLKIFRDSQLFMPVTFSSNLFEGIENSKSGDVLEPEGQVGFDINYLTAENGSKAVPLFTSDEMMEKADIRCSTYVLFMSDLADMLKQTDKYSAIAINPFTDHDLVMPMHVFLNLFYEPTEEEKKFFESLDVILEILAKNSVELEKDTALVFKSDENVMVENAVDGVFVPKIPFTVSSNPDYGEGLKYTNVLLMPESKKILPIGNDAEEDIIIAPGTEFILKEEVDEFTTVWKCGAQPFYED